MRRSSVIGPMLLILIGLAFLVHNLWPEVPVGELLAQNWPFVLIIWGFLRLAEILIWAMTGKPLPRSGISGGEWVFVIFLCLIGSSMYTARHYTGWFPTGRSLRGMVISLGETYDFDIAPITKTAKATPHIIIESFRGNARITGVEGDELKINGRKTIRAFQQAEADRANRQTPVEVFAQGDDLIIRTNQDRVSDNLRVSDDLEITVPKGASVEAHGRYGDFDFRDLGGSVDLNSDNAGVRLDNVAGDVRIEVRNSDIVRATSIKGGVELKGHGHDVDLQNIDGPVTINGDFLGEIRMNKLLQPVRFNGAHADIQFEKLPGQAHMDLGAFTATNIVGPIHMNSRARDVNISEFTQSLELSLDRGDIELKPDGKNAVPKIDVQTRSGDIDLALPPGARFDLRMSTLRGEAHNEFGAPLTIEDHARGATIVGMVGTGPDLRLETNRGNVTARKVSRESGNSSDVDLKIEKQ